MSEPCSTNTQPLSHTAIESYGHQGCTRPMPARSGPLKLEIFPSIYFKMNQFHSIHRSHFGENFEEGKKLFGNR